MFISAETGYPCNQLFKNEHGTIEKLALRHLPGEPECSYPVVAGRVEIIDQLDHKEEAFTFGGPLRVSPQEQATVCLLNSPAPMLETVCDPADIYRKVGVEDVGVLKETNNR